MIIFSLTPIYILSNTIKLWKNESQIMQKFSSLKIFIPTTFTTTPTTSTDIMQKSPNYNDKTYVMAAYIISSTRIRLTTIRKCKTMIRLHFHLQINESNFLTIPLIHEPILKCPWFYAIKCDFVGYFAITVHHEELNQLLMKMKSYKNLPKAYISRMDKPELKMPVVLHDARIMQNQPRKHYLAVCLQPIFLLADWTLLVQFFEIWIAQGVTKFCVYVQSMTPEVDALLRVYEHSKDVEIELINWAPLPTDNVNTHQSDPNLRIYRAEVATSINDCLLRIRGHAKYVISSDLDEIMVNYEESSLLQLFDNLHEKFKKSAAFIIRSSFALFEVIVLRFLRFLSVTNFSLLENYFKKIFENNIILFKNIL
uniref:Glycosyltransferase family 92 protein n=1 Tax=Wuchereria bancrofti TaxID=6293 RepID=A0A1I8EWX4_WUCBA